MDPMEDILNLIMGQKDQVPARRVPTQRQVPGPEFDDNHPSAYKYGAFVKDNPTYSMLDPQQVNRIDPIPHGMVPSEDDKLSNEGQHGIEDESDGGQANRMNRIIYEDYDGSEFFKMSGKEALTGALGLKVSPELERFWDNTDEMDRQYIIEAIQNTAGMGTDQNIMEETGRAKAAEDTESQILDTIMDK